MFWVVAQNMLTTVLQVCSPYSGLTRAVELDYLQVGIALFQSIHSKVLITCCVDLYNRVPAWILESWVCVQMVKDLTCMKLRIASLSHFSDICVMPFRKALDCNTALPHPVDQAVVIGHHLSNCRGKTGSIVSEEWWPTIIEAIQK